MVTFVWILGAAVVFELLFALDCFRKMLKAQRDFKGVQTMLTASVQIAEGKEMDLLNVRELLSRKVEESNYLRGVLDEHGIEWETGWRKLS